MKGYGTAATLLGSSKFIYIAEVLKRQLLLRVNVVLAEPIPGTVTRP